MHTIKITSNSLFKYQCTSGKFIRLPNRIEKNRFGSENRIESFLPELECSTEFPLAAQTRVARSPVFYGRSRISAPVSRLLGDRISRILLQADRDRPNLQAVTRIYTMPHGVTNKIILCSEHSIKTRLFCRNSTLFGPRFNYIGIVHFGSRRTLAS